MLKKLILIVLVLMITPDGYCETITFKSGNVIEGKILQIKVLKNVPK